MIKTLLLCFLLVGCSANPYAKPRIILSQDLLKGGDPKLNAGVEIGININKKD